MKYAINILCENGEEAKKVIDAVEACGGTCDATPAPEPEAPAEDEADDFGSEEETEDEAADTDEDFGADEEPVKPAAKTKPAKAPKVTLKDVNEAAKAHAKKNKAKREGTLKVLAKFKVKSVSELKPEQYAEVIKALKV